MGKSGVFFPVLNNFQIQKEENLRKTDERKFIISTDK
jgi:hypothetical protein